MLLSSCCGHLEVLVLLLHAVVSSFPSGTESDSATDVLLALAPRAHAVLWGALCHANTEGTHCLLYACEGGHAAVVELLFALARVLESCEANAPASLRALVNQADKAGSTPLHVALSAGARSIAMALLEAGADPNSRTEDGFCPLLLAAQEGDVQLCSALLARGADPNARDAFSGNSALHVALESGRLDLVVLLLDAEATDASVANSQALTPLMLARSRHDDAAVDLLQARLARAVPDVHKT